MNFEINDEALPLGFEFLNDSDDEVKSQTGSHGMDTNEETQASSSDVDLKMKLNAQCWYPLSS